MEQLSIFDFGIENNNIITTTENIIRANELKIMQIESFLYTRDGWKYEDGHWHVISATIALLENNMVYLKDFYSYPFLYVFNTSKKAYSFYMKNLEKIRDYAKYDTDVHCKIDIHNEFYKWYTKNVQKIQYKNVQLLP